MHLLRTRSRFLGLVGRGVLLWFVLSLGVAVASPIVRPQTVELVCAASGAVKAVVQTDDGVQELGASHLDCPLCVLTGAPPPSMLAAAVERVLPEGRTARSIPAARMAAVPAAPLPARGPPSVA